jgi:hypothetical protein
MENIAIRLRLCGRFVKPTGCDVVGQFGVND